MMLVVMLWLRVGLLRRRRWVWRKGRRRARNEVFHVILARTKIPQDWKVPEIPSIQNLGITKEIRPCLYDQGA
jgi:hypothetical protein